MIICNIGKLKMLRQIDIGLSIRVRESQRWSKRPAPKDQENYQAQQTEKGVAIVIPTFCMLDTIIFIGWRPSPIWGFDCWDPFN